MVEYSFDEAITLLSGNLSSAEKNLANVLEDLDFLKDQITTTEVSILLLRTFFISFTRKILLEFTTMMSKSEDPRSLQPNFLSSVYHDSIRIQFASKYRVC